MKYSAPEMAITEFETVFTSGDDMIPADATASELGYDTSVSYSEILWAAAQAAQPVIKYKE